MLYYISVVEFSLLFIKAHTLDCSIVHILFRKFVQVKISVG